MTEKTPYVICYLGIYRPTAPRDKIYFDGLKKQGIEVIECVDGSPGLSKFFRLFKKHSALKGHYDILWVGYLSTMCVPLARLISRRKIVFNALDSWYDRAILDRGMHSRFSPVAWFIWFFDFLAFHLAHSVLVDSERQKLFLTRKFFVNPEKFHAVFTGADEEIFHPDPTIAKSEKFTVFFRGMFLPATGIEYVIEAARILKDEDIRFRIIGWGQPLQNKLTEMISDYKLDKVDLTTVFLPPDELRKTILSSYVMLGQFADHPRMERTIQHKTFEALALGMPYITRDSKSNRELLHDDIDSMFVPPAKPEALAKSIVKLKNDTVFRQSIGDAAYRLYKEKCNSEVLSTQVQSILQSFN